ncbi:hypothetical protein AMTRI_Chr07g80240 [Amborella trichopoda]
MPSKFSASLSLEASKGVEKLMSNGTNSLSLTPNFIVPPDMRPQLSEVSTCETIPLIDLSLLHAHDNTTGRAEIIRQISTASQDYGFFQELKESMLHVAKESFEMPIEERAKFYLEDPKKQTRVSTIWRDYFRHPCYPLEDYIDSWPQKPENYRLLILKLLALLSEGLGVDPNYLNQKLGEKPNQVLLINYYPPCPNPDLTLGIAGHSDPNAITVLQQGEVGGLHVFKDGKWFAIEPVKNAFVVNIADQLEVISNGRFKSVLHCAVTNSMAARISIPMFYAPFVDAIIEPAEELVSEETLAIYRSYKFGEFFNISAQSGTLYFIYFYHYFFFICYMARRRPALWVQGLGQGQGQGWHLPNPARCHPYLNRWIWRLGLDPSYWNEKFGKHNLIQMINYYPPCEVGGLQVLKDGKWINVKPKKNVFVVNIGYQLQVISNGRFKSVEHRAITKSTSSRISLPTFYGPSLDASIGPANELVSKESPAIYRSYTFGEFFDRLLSWLTKVDVVQRKVGTFCLSSAAMAEVAKELEKLISNGVNSKYLTLFSLEERPKFSSDESLSESIPVIDLSCVFDGLGRQYIIRQIFKASEEYGFLQLILLFLLNVLDMIINHGVPKDVIQDIQGVATEFFEMPNEERANVYSEDPKTQVRVCTSFNFKSKVQLWRDFLRHPCHPLEDYIDSLPQKPENYREVACKYALEIRALILKLLALFSEGLGLDSGYLNGKFGKHNQIQLINYYPPCPDPNLTLGLPGHSDPNGLQVLKDGKWIIVKPEKNAFVVNIADQLQSFMCWCEWFRLSAAGGLKSWNTDAITNSTSSRISIPTFYVSKEGPAIYRSYTFGEFFDRFFSQELKGKTVLDHFK